MNRELLRDGHRACGGVPQSGGQPSQAVGDAAGTVQAAENVDESQFGASASAACVENMAGAREKKG